MDPVDPVDVLSDRQNLEEILGDRHLFLFFQELTTEPECVKIYASDFDKQENQ